MSFRRSSAPRRNRRWWRRARAAAGVAIVVVVVCGIALRVVPYAGADRVRALAFSRVYLDRHGAELAVRPVNDEGLRRLYVPLEEAPEDLVRLVRRAEDARFFVHLGVDPLSVARAAVQYARTGRPVSGASTITMQLASMLHPRPATIGGKVREALDALVLEARLSKRQILELYGNLVPVGRNVEGFPAAARVYFDRDIAELTAAQLAVLAALPRNPAENDPWLHREANRAVAERILGGPSVAYHDRGDIDAALRSLADPGRSTTWAFEAPHLIGYVERTRERAGDGRGPMRRVVRSFSGAFRTRLSLDLDLQHRVEHVLRAAVADADEYRIGDAAAIAADPRTGEILAYVGSPDFFDPAGGQIDGVQILREPGSTLKPFLYAQAFEMGFTAASVVPDIPLDFGGERVYVPANFNDQFHGPLRVREALAGSLNVPAVYTLERVSVERFTDTLIRLGFGSLSDARGSLGVSLALGGADVSLYELVQGYLSLYDDGSSPPLTWRADPEVHPAPHWSASTASVIRDIISTNDDRVMTFGRRSPLRFDFPVAIKTGTSNQFTNVWAVGFSADIAAGVWMGNFDGETVIGAPGSSLPAEALHTIISDASSGSALPPLEGVRAERICALSGMAATDACPTVLREWIPRDRSLDPCDWHRPETGGTAVYPQIYRVWADRYGYRLQFRREAPLGIVSPIDHAVFYRDPTANPRAQQIRVFVTGTGDGELFHNGERVYAGPLPRSVFWPLTEGVHEFRLLQPESGESVMSRIEVR